MKEINFFANKKETYTNITTPKNNLSNSRGKIGFVLIDDYCKSTSRIFLDHIDILYQECVQICL